MKPIITTLDRTERRLELKFKKNQGFVELMLHLIRRFNLNWGVFKDHDYETAMDKKTTLDKISAYADELLHFEDNKVKIDIFIGSSKAILVMLSSPALQQKVLDEIISRSEWIKWTKEK
jgi:hypothetical protein